MSAAVQVEGVVDGDRLQLSWSDARSSGACRFDRVPGTSPEWLGDADELLEGASRRQERAVLDAVASWAQAQGLDLGVWTDGEGVDQLG